MFFTIINTTAEGIALGEIIPFNIVSGTQGHDGLTPYQATLSLKSLSLAALKNIEYKMYV